MIELRRLDLIIIEDALGVLAKQGGWQLADDEFKNEVALLARAISTEVNDSPAGSYFHLTRYAEHPMVQR